MPIASPSTAAMNEPEPRPRWRPPWRWMLRHALAMLLGMAWPPVAAVVLYVVLLVFAIVTGSGLGGPLALPAMVAGGLVFGLWSTLGVAFPSVALAGRIVRRHGFAAALRRLGLSQLFAALLVMLWAIPACHFLASGMPCTALDWLKTTAVMFTAAMLPVTFYHVCASPWFEKP